MKKINIDVSGPVNSGKSTIIEIIIDALYEKGFDNLMIHYNNQLTEETIHERTKHKSQRLEAVKRYIEEININEIQTNKEFTKGINHAKSYN